MAGQLGLTLRAAGGVVWRHGDAEIEVLVIHPPGCRDWTFPKGKQDADDRDVEHTALREVHEETGYHCIAGEELIAIEYVDRKGRYKHATYWEMQVLSGSFEVNREVDEIRWLPMRRVHEVLSSERDRQVLAAFHRWCA